MKRFMFVIVAMFMLLTTAYTADKVVAVGSKKVTLELTKEVKEAKAAVVVTWEMWRSAKDSATKLDDEGSLPLASEAYLEYAKYGEALGRLELKAWGLNNAAYCIIKMHKFDSKVDLKPAKQYLEQAFQIKEAVADCTRAINSNLDYVNYHLGEKKESLTPAKNFTTPETKVAPMKK